MILAMQQSNAHKIDGSYTYCLQAKKQHSPSSVRGKAQLCKFTKKDRHDNIPFERKAEKTDTRQEKEKNKGKKEKKTRCVSEV